MSADLSSTREVGGTATQALRLLANLDHIGCVADIHTLDVVLFMKDGSAVVYNAEDNDAIAVAADKLDDMLNQIGYTR